MTESNTGLTFHQETLLVIRRDGEIVAIEEVNGHITRHITKRATKQDSLELFGADKPTKS